jgi:hypothetical protein
MSFGPPSVQDMPIGSGRLHVPPPPLARTSSRHRSTRQTRGSPRGALGSGPRSSASARRPTSVILTRATSIARPPAITRSVRVVTIPVRMINQEIDREPVREHDRLAAAVGGCGEQFEPGGGARASGRACGANRLSASRPFCSGGGPARWVVSCAHIRWTPWPSKTRLQRST